jgi:hypothetical protein
VYPALSILALLLHLAWILWILLGWLLTKGRPFFARIHVLSLVWGAIVELGPWPCPLTLAEQWLEARAGVTSYTGGFLIHYLDKLIYPDLPESVVAWTGASVCMLILAIHVVRWKKMRR